MRSRAPYRRPEYKLEPTPIPDRSGRLRGYHAHNGIAAKLFRYLTKLSKLPKSEHHAVRVPIPPTTSPEAFRIYLLNYFRSRKELLVSTSLRKPKKELIVWLRDSQVPRAPLAESKSISFTRLEMAPLWPLDATDEDAGDSSEDYIDADGTPVMRL